MTATPTRRPRKVAAAEVTSPQAEVTATAPAKKVPVAKAASPAKATKAPAKAPAAKAPAAKATKAKAPRAAVTLPKGYAIKYDNGAYDLAKKGPDAPADAAKWLVICNQHGTKTTAASAKEGDSLGSKAGRLTWCTKCQAAAKA